MLDYEKIKGSHKYEILTLSGNRPQYSIMVSTLAEFINQLELLNFSNNHTYLYKNIPDKTEVSINNSAEKEKLLSDLWAKELTTRTDLSKGLTNSQIDEKQAEHYRKYEVEAKKSGLEITLFISQENISHNSQNPTKFSSRYEEEMDATRSGFSLEDVIPNEVRWRNKEIVGKISFYDFDGSIAEIMEYTSENSYLNALKNELDSNMGGFKYETLIKTPELIKKTDDLLYNAYGEVNPNSLDAYIEKIKNEENNSNNQKTNSMETEKEFDPVQYLKDQLKYLGFGEDEKLHKDLEKGINSPNQQFEIKTTSDKTLPRNKADFTLNYNKTEKGGVFLNSFDTNLTNEKGNSISQNFRVSREDSFTAKEAVNLLEGRSVKIEFDNPKTKEREPAFVKLNFEEGKNQYGNYNFQTFYKNYGVDTVKIVENSNLIFDKPEYCENTIKSLEKGNVVKVKFEQDGNVMEGKAILNPQYKNLSLYDNDMNRINTNKPLESLDQDNKHDKNNVREQSKSRNI